MFRRRGPAGCAGRWARILADLRTNDPGAQLNVDAMATRAYSSDVAEHALQVETVVQAISRQKQATYKAEKQVEVEIEKFVDEKKDAYTHTCRSSDSVSGAVGLGVAGALGVAADASAFFLAAVTEAAAAHILPDSVPQAFATWISTLAGQVGGADNASLVVAAAAGLSAAVAVKTSLYATRRGPRRRARAELAAAKQQLHEQVSKRRRVEREALDASRAAKRIRQVRNWAEKGGEGEDGEEDEEGEEGEEGEEQGEEGEEEEGGQDASEGEEASSD